MAKSGYTRKSVVGESTKGAKSNAMDNGVRTVQVKSVKQDIQEKLESSDPMLNLGITQSDTKLEATVTRS